MLSDTLHKWLRFSALSPSCRASATPGLSSSVSEWLHCEFCYVYSRPPPFSLVAGRLQGLCRAQLYGLSSSSINRVNQIRTMCFNSVPPLCSCCWVRRLPVLMARYAFPTGSLHSRCSLIISDSAVATARIRGPSSGARLPPCGPSFFSVLSLC